MKVTAALAACCSLMIAMPAMAHHSFSMFDRDKTLTLNGTVKELEWTNPHAWLYVMVADDSGKIIEYPLEMQSTGQAMKNGWRADSIKPGDKVSVVMHPLRSGSHGGQLLYVTLPNGHKLAVTRGTVEAPAAE
ncbi:MAG TPA: DUF6152 family protein [Micropepsaceae bacterium]|nr:DUF6152 family protein [Micropepsaceae bacterium]